MARLIQDVFTALLWLSFFVRVVRPATAPVPDVIEALPAPAEIVANHGHSHGMEDDLYWAMHCHSDDVAGHDHSTALLLRGARASAEEGNTTPV